MTSMADVKSSSWTCVSEGDKVAVFDDVSLVLMTPSPEEVLKNGERLTRHKTFREDDSADGVIFRGCNDHRQNLVCFSKSRFLFLCHLIFLSKKRNTFMTIPS